MKFRNLPYLQLAISLTFAAITWFVLSHAWLTDDAYFTFRTIDNFINGYGPVWNTIERVQVYSHPLWMLALSVFYFFTREAFLTSIFVSLVCTLIACWFLYKISVNPWHGLASLWLLALSTTFVDYSTSGLENPLSHLLLVIFLYVLLRTPNRDRKLFWLAFVAALATVNRHDTILFYLPTLGLLGWGKQSKKADLLNLVLGFLPLLVWEMFSLIYYGLPFPNTFYAKTQNFVPLVAEVWNGLTYFYFTIRYDPLTWVVILTAFAIALASKSKMAISVVAGFGLYLIYILRIGGDFMGHRFLSTVFVGSVVVLAFFGFGKLKSKHIWLVPVTAFLLSLLAISPPYQLYPINFQRTKFRNAGNEIVDERMIFFYASLFQIEDQFEFASDPSHHLMNEVAFLIKSIYRGTIFRTEPDTNWVADGRSLLERSEQEGWYVTLEGASGMPAFYAGPNVHIVQPLALTDVFLSHIPPLHYPNWRSAHFQRIVPGGYVELLRGSATHLEDEALDTLLRRVLLVTQGQLISAGRITAIWELNTSNIFDRVPNLQTKYRFMFATHIPSNGRGVTEPEEPVTFSDGGGAVQLEFSSPITATEIRLRMQAGDNFEIVFLDGEDRPVASNLLLSSVASGIETFSFTPPQHTESEIYSLRIQPVRYFSQAADGSYTFYSLELIAE